MKKSELSNDRLSEIKSKILEHKKTMEQSILSIGKLLLEVKTTLKHGEWIEWVQNEVEFSQATANRFMKIFKEFSNSSTLINLGYSKLTLLSSIPKKDRDEFIESIENIETVSFRVLNDKVKEYKDSNKKTKKEKQEEEIIDAPTSLIIQEDISEIWEYTIKLNKELHMRCGSDEDLESTLVARYEAKEINLQQFNDIIAQNKLNLPIFFYKESLGVYLDRMDFYSNYEQYDDNQDIKQDRRYYCMFDKNFEWHEVIKCYDEKDEDSIDWSKNNHVDNVLYQLSEACDDNGYTYICIYKNYNLQGTFKDGNLDNIKALCDYDNNLNYEQLKALYEQLEQQIKGYEERNIIRQAKECEEREKRREKEKKYNEALENWTKNYQPYTMGKWSFEDIWDEQGKIYNYQLWNEMSSFVNKEKSKQYESWSNMFTGGNSLVVYNDEEKKILPKMKKILIKNFHPDVFKDGNGQEIDLINKIFNNIK